MKEEEKVEEKLVVVAGLSMVETCQQLVSELEGIATSSSSSSRSSVARPYQEDFKKDGDVNASQPFVDDDDDYPSHKQFYSMGLILYRIHNPQRPNHQNNHPHIHDLLRAYQDLIHSIPPSILQQTFSTFLLEVIQSHQQPPIVGYVPVGQSLVGLLSNSSKLCSTIYSKQWISTLAAIYDILFMSMSKDDLDETSDTVVAATLTLSCISFLLLDGLLMRDVDDDHDDDGTSIEEELLEAIRVMEEQSLDCLRDLQSWQAQHEPSHRTLEGCIGQLSRDTDDDDKVQQREYIVSMLETARHQIPSTQVPSVAASVSSGRADPHNHHNHNTTKPSSSAAAAASGAVLSSSSSAVDEVERRIQQVKQIFPHFGEGFIETALSMYGGDVETTVSHLLNDPSDYPATLRVVDPTLPRRKKEYHSRTEAEDAQLARQLVKERVALDEDREQERYKALLYVSRQEHDVHPDRMQESTRTEDEDLYDDDYDDQYDDVDVRLGSLDNGFTMDNFDQVRLYNQIVKEDEAEGAFWEENRNTNRSKTAEGSKTNDKDHDGGGSEKRYHGPDKIKGGRVIGPDGKVVKKPFGARKRNNNTGNNNNNNNNNTQPKGGGNQNEAKSTNGNRNNAGNTGGQSNSKQSSAGTTGNNVTNKPRTKPKSDNRVNRQRDRKQKQQGAFGVQD